MLIQILINGIITGSIYALVSLGFALVYNTTRCFHIAYATVYTFASYMILTFYKQLELPFLLAFLTAIFLTVVLSILIEKIVYVPLVKNYSSLNVILISSIGVMIVIGNLIAMVYGNETQILNQNIANSFKFGDIIITYTQIFQFGISLTVIALFFIFLKFSGFGLKTRALRDDPTLYKSFGMDVFRMRAYLFGLSGFLAALASGLVAYDVGMAPYLGMPMLLNSVVALIIGGVGRFEAPIIGGFLIGVLQAFAVWALSSRWQHAATFTLLILFLLFRSQGLIGEKQRAV